MRCSFTAFYFCIIVTSCAVKINQEEAPPRFELTLVDSTAHAFATFQSHNQKVVSNQFGIFMTHIRSRNTAYTAQTWRLSMSKNGGKTFETIYEDIHATNPPVIETDTEGNIYLVRVDLLDSHAYLYRFLASKDFKDPEISQISGGAAGKYSMILDETEDQLVFVSKRNKLFHINLDGTVVERTNILQPGKNAFMMYPLLSISEEGDLHFAWTNQKYGQYMYWDIHHMYLPKGDSIWKNMGASSLDLPPISDDTGPTTRISQDNEFEVHTRLSNFMVKDDKAHFLYLAQSRPKHQYYVRYDIATGLEEIRHELDEIQSLGGVLVKDKLSSSRLYCISMKGGYLVAMVSNNHGDDWSVFAKGALKFRSGSLGGFRETTEDGFIIGTFTDQKSPPSSLNSDSHVYFYKIKVPLEVEGSPDEVIVQE